MFVYLILLPRACVKQSRAMNNKRYFLFIDSSNVYHALKKSGFLEFFSYKKLFEEFSKKFSIQEIYFYDAIKNRVIEPQGYSRQQAFHEKLVKEMPCVSLRTRKLRYLGFAERLDAGLAELNLCQKCFVKIKQLLALLGLFKVSMEKGIDILLGADVIKAAFENKFDGALLFSGDADFVPAVELVQELGKEVINIHFYSGSASELRQKCNAHILVSFNSKGELLIK